MQLRDYQEQDVNRIVNNKCIGNFSEQRTGKTPTTCVALQRMNLPHTLIVCPASLMYVWKEEWEKWTGFNAFVVPSTSYDYNELPYDTTVIINYDKIRGNKNSQNVCDRLVKWKPDAMILDEAHRMKDRKSLTSVALYRFIPIVDVRIALTGTPATNKPWDVWSVLHWLFPKEYKSYWNFTNEYFEEEVIWVGGEPHRRPAKFKPGMETILQANLDIKCIQHKRSEVMPWLPEEEIPTEVMLPLNPTQKRAISDLINYFEHKHIVTQTVLDNMIRVRQVCAAPAILKLKSKSPKVEWLEQYIKDYPEKSILVFSNSKKLLYYTKGELKIHTEIICGDVPADKRKDIVTRFQGGALKVLLCQTQACKEGLTLDQADVSIFLDTYPPAADYLQAKDRMVAVSEERNKPKELIHVMMRGTYDEKMYRLVENNVDETAIINDYKNYIKERRLANGK